MAVGATTAGAGIVVASAAAGSLASQQAAAGGGASGGRVARLAALTGRTARNLGSAAASDIGGRLSGTRTNRGSMPFRMAADLRNRSAQCGACASGPPGCARRNPLAVVATATRSNQAETSAARLRPGGLKRV